MAIELSKIPVLSAAKVDVKKVDEAIEKQSGQSAWHRGETLTQKDREYFADVITEYWKVFGPANIHSDFASSIGCPPSYCKQVLDELDAAAKSEAGKK
jgi:hypothetical protein